MSITTPVLHAKDITDTAALAAVVVESFRYGSELSLPGRPSLPASRWNVAEALGVNEKIVLAKLRKLTRRGLLDGCTCGCRGDFTITDAGGELLGSLA